MDGETKQDQGKQEGSGSGGGGESGTTRQSSVKSSDSIDSARPPEPLQLFPEENNPLKPRPYSAT